MRYLLLGAFAEDVIDVVVSGDVVQVFQAERRRVNRLAEHMISQSATKLAEQL